MKPPNQITGCLSLLRHPARLTQIVGRSSMHTAAVIVLCFAATAAAGFLLAGFCALLAHDDADLQRLQDKVAEARRVGRWEAYWTMRREALRASDVLSHWRTRPEVRRSIWLGLAFGIITLIAVQFL
jgi:hypothetical protein